MLGLGDLNRCALWDLGDLAYVAPCRNFHEQYDKFPATSCYMYKPLDPVSQMAKFLS